MVVLGLVALPRMRTQFFPDVVVNNVTVRVVWAGAEDVDEAIIQVLNPVLLAVEGWKTPTPMPAKQARFW